MKVNVMAMKEIVVIFLLYVDIFWLGDILPNQIRWNFFLLKNERSNNFFNTLKNDYYRLLLLQPLFNQFLLRYSFVKRTKTSYKVTWVPHGKTFKELRGREDKILGMKRVSDISAIMGAWCSMICNIDGALQHIHAEADRYPITIYPVHICLARPGMHYNG